MLSIIGIIFPVFAGIGLGYFTVWKGVFSQSDLKVLGKFVLNIALPALMFNAVAGNSLGDALVPEWMIAYGIAGLATVGIAYAVFTVQKMEPTRRAIGSMGVYCPNSGYIGYPIMLLAFPSIATQTFAMAVIVENFLTVPLAIILCDLSRGNDGRRFWQLIGPILWGVLKRPMIIGLLLGILVALFQIPVPAPALRFMTMLGNATAALALFAIGGSLVGLPIRGNVPVAAQVVFGKLILHPAMGIGAMALLALVGLPDLPSDLRAALIITCATPMMGIYTILAQEYGHEGMASISMLGATIGSFFTYTALLFWLM